MILSVYASKTAEEWCKTSLNACKILLTVQYVLNSANKESFTTEKRGKSVSKGKP
jgi:hypothetical protein